MNFFQRRAILKQANYLELVPLHTVSYEIDPEAGLVTILMPKFISKFFSKHFTSLLRYPHTKIKLDELGSVVWLAIDGEKNVNVIVSELEGKNKVETGSAEKRVVAFLTLLYEQRLISFKELLFIKI